MFGFLCTFYSYMYNQNHIINNLVDYVLGVEVGMDTNGRKNRTGDVM